MHEGEVKFFDPEKCFGFIVLDDKSELYVHAGDLIDLVRKGDKVSFEIQDDNGDKSAFNVRRLNKRR